MRNIFLGKSYTRCGGEIIDLNSTNLSRVETQGNNCKLTTLF